MLDAIETLDPYFDGCDGIEDAHILSAWSRIKKFIEETQNTSTNSAIAEILSELDKAETMCRDGYPKFAVTHIQAVRSKLRQ